MYAALVRGVRRGVRTEGGGHAFLRLLSGCLQTCSVEGMGTFVEP